MVGFLSNQFTPQATTGQFLGDALSGLGAGLLAYGAGGPYRNQASIIGLQALQQAPQVRRQQAMDALQMQYLQQRGMDYAAQAAQREQEAQRQQALQSRYKALIGGQPQQGPVQPGQPPLPNSPVNPALSSLPPAIQQMLPAMDPQQGMGLIAQLSTQKAQPPKLETWREGNQQVSGWIDAQGNKHVVGSGAAFAPQQPQQLPSDIQEFNFAKQQGFQGGFTDFLNTKRGSTQMVQTGVDQQGNPIFSFQPTAATKPPTEDQAKNNQLYQRTSQQLPIIQKNFDALANLSNQAVSKVPFVSGYLTSPEFQQADNALTDVIASYLYSVSGATANPGEVANLKKTVTPYPGESKDSREQKLQRIQEMVDSIRLRTQQAQQPSAPTMQPTSPAMPPVQPAAPATNKPDPLGIR